MPLIRLTTKQILLYLVDGFLGASLIFDRHGLYHKSFDDYFKWREIDKKQFRDCLRRLEKQGIVKLYQQGNQGWIELSKKGKDKVSFLLAEDYKFKYPQKWDLKWRIVIFDIPNDKKTAREIFRERLKSIGFVQLQESVFVFPFDCKEVIDYFKGLYLVQKEVQYIVAESIETDKDLVDLFIDREILKRKMLE